MSTFGPLQLHSYVHIIIMDEFFLSKYLGLLNKWRVLYLVFANFGLLDEILHLLIDCYPRTTVEISTFVKVLVGFIEFAIRVKLVNTDSTLL